MKFLMNIRCDITAQGQGAYRDRLFSGAFASTIRYREIGLDITLSGSFDINLA